MLDHPPRHESTREITHLLHRARAGDSDAESRLLPAVYRELHGIAERRMRYERRDHTLQPTILVHEAFLHLMATDKIEWQDRAHFYALASKIMRRVLVDYARAARAAKRPGKMRRVEIHSQIAATAEKVDVLVLHELLDRLSALDERQSRIVEMRYFAGLPFEEIAETLSISPRTAKRDWSVARAWLYAELVGNGSPSNER